MDSRVIDAYARHLGLKSVFVQRFLAAGATSRLWRVASVERGLCSLIAVEADGHPSECQAQPGDESVAVGDWVLAEEKIAGFADIDDLALDCRFADCHHESEPGCEVRAAVERGELPLDRVESYRDIARDAARLRAKSDPYSRHLERLEGRRFGRLVRTLIGHKAPR